MKKIICTVTNDLVYDQRMIRICTSLSNAGYQVQLVGRKKKKSPPLKEQAFEQKRLNCITQQGKWFYIEYNIRLFFYLIFSKADVYCAIDLDSILPNLWASKLRGKKRMYDAHELFCEMEEIIRRPRIYKLWKRIERYAVPQFKLGYTIGDCYKKEFQDMYGVDYEIVRNACVYNEENNPNKNKEKHVYYQGAVNEGRCFETLLPAMQSVYYPLIVCGEGNFMEQAKALAQTNGISDRVDFKGYQEPLKLKAFTKDAYIGLTLFQETGKSNLYSLANRFFDYFHFGVPQVAMNYPEYAKINSEYEIAVLINENSSEAIAEALNKLLSDDAYYNRLAANCLKAREAYNWQHEEKKLVAYYKKHVG